MIATKITQEQIKKIAKLCNLNLTDTETEKLSFMFSDTLQYMNVLEELDTLGVDETYQVTGLKNIYLKADNKRTLKKEEALSNAKEVIKGMFATQGVFDR